MTRNSFAVHICLLINTTEKDVLPLCYTFICIVLLARARAELQGEGERQRQSERARP